MAGERYYHDTTEIHVASRHAELEGAGDDCECSNDSLFDIYVFGITANTPTGGLMYDCIVNLQCSLCCRTALTYLWWS
jgi:hypothetical protein